MSLPGDENPNPQWQLPGQEKPQWSSGSPLGDGADDPPPPAPQWQQPPQSEWQRQPQSQWQQPQSPPPAQQYPGWVPPPRTPGQAYASLILGIVGLVVCPLLPSIAALITGYGAKSQIDRAAGQLGGRGIALAGIVLGWVAVGLWALILLIIVVASAGA
jgi:uncharacterized protein DUF4190